MTPRGRITPEELVDLIIENDARLREQAGKPPIRFTPAQRLWIEPLFNFIGFLIGQLVLFLPWPWVWKVQLWICGKLAGHPPENNPHLAERIQQTVHLSQELHRQTGQWPALLIGTSHPETTGDGAWLRFELLRQGLEIAGAVVDAMPSQRSRWHPQCFLAIDPFALDSVPVPIQGLYAGFMHRQYLAWDRQASTQSWIQKLFLLRRTGHDQIGWRLIRALRQNPVLMAIGGGIPSNARLLYAAREAIVHLTLKHWPMTRREAQHRLMKIVGRPWDLRIENEAHAFFLALGLDHTEANRAIADLRTNILREVPSRHRLWRALVGRLVKKGTPLIAIAITHREASPHVVVSPPIGFAHPPADLSAWSHEFADLF